MSIRKYVGFKNEYKNEFKISVFSILACILCLNNLVHCLTYSANDYFDEELLLKPLPSGHIYAYFQFTTLWDVEFESTSCERYFEILEPGNIIPPKLVAGLLTVDAAPNGNKLSSHKFGVGRMQPWHHGTESTLLAVHHCHFFPRALGEIVGRYNVQELHISLTQGLWRYETWGYPVLDAAPGAELWTWFRNDTEDIENTWKELTGALSGLLCASLNFIDTSNSQSPEFSFQPSGVVDSTTVNSSYLRYATLPREIVCTENLTPWKKLLPCNAKKGLSTLLNAGNIYSTNYHSLGLHLRPVCRDEKCTQRSVELRQTVSLVYDLVILGTGGNEWSIKKLFGIGLSGACPLATMSNIYIDVTVNETETPFQLNPPPPAIIRSSRGGYDSKLAVYDVKAFEFSGMFNIAATYLSEKVYAVNIPPILYANRYIIGYGQEYGGIVTKIHNGHWKPLDIIYLENIPWFLPVYLHTLKIVSNGMEIKPLLKRYIPGKARTHPYYLEVALRLPARSVTQISIEFDYVFLKWQEYPPDANHGFYIGAAVITALLPIARNYTGLPQDGSTLTSSFNASRNGYLVQLRTETLIVTLPTPDFSMPYNVICLACTVVALAFGPLHNITTKRLRLKDGAGQNRLLSWVRNLLRRNPQKEEKEE